VGYGRDGVLPTCTECCSMAWHWYESDNRPLGYQQPNGVGHQGTQGISQGPHELTLVREHRRLTHTLIVGAEGTLITAPSTPSRHSQTGCAQWCAPGFAGHACTGQDQVRDIVQPAHWATVQTQRARANMAARGCGELVGVRGCDTPGALGPGARVKPKHHAVCTHGQAG